MSSSPAQAAKITAFSLPVGEEGADVPGVISGNTISVTAVAGTTVTALAATFTATAGATVKVGSTTQTSGTTTNDFTNPVQYVVSKSGMTSTTYTVTVTVSE